MSRYTWGSPAQDQGNITGSRLADQIVGRIPGLAGYNQDTAKDAALAELLASTPEVFHVSAFGAVGDGVQDDTAAIQAAIAQADANGGGVVYLPVGIYLVSEEINLPNLVGLQGGAVRSGVVANPGTTIKWNGASSPSNAVITANLAGGVFAQSVQLKLLRVNASGASVGLRLAGLNESCVVEDVEVYDATDVQIHLDQATNGERTQNCNFTRLKVSARAASIGFLLEQVRFCSFINITVDTADDDPVAIGLAMENGCWNNVFLTPHLENCTLPCEIGYNSGSNNVGNTFIGTSINAPEVTPDDTTVGGDTGTMGFLIRNATNLHTRIINLRDEDEYDWPIYDEAQAVKVTERAIVRDFAGDQLNQLAASNDDYDVTNIRYVQVATSGGSVVLGGLQGGIKGQRLVLFKRTSANDFTIEHNEGAGTQSILTPDGNDIVLSTYGGVELVCDGSNWFVVSVDTGTLGDVQITGALNHDGSTTGFFAATPVGQQNVPLTSPTVQNVIDGLVALGLFEQSD